MTTILYIIAAIAAAYLTVHFIVWLIFPRALPPEDFEHIDSEAASRLSGRGRE